MSELTRHSSPGTLVERDPERAARIAAYQRSRHEFYDLQREHIAPGRSPSALSPRRDECPARAKPSRKPAACGDHMSSPADLPGEGAEPDDE